MVLVSANIISHVGKVPKKVKKDTQESDLVIAEWTKIKNPEPYHTYLENLGEKLYPIQGNKKSMDCLYEAIKKHRRNEDYSNELQTYLKMEIQKANHIRQKIIKEKRTNKKISLVTGDIIYTIIEPMLGKKGIKPKINYHEKLPIPEFWEEVFRHIENYSTSFDK